jgi:hypothetical protein
MTNLTELDLRRIETIEGYLRQLDMCNPEYSLPQFKPYQPINTTEGEVEYRKMLTESMMNITKGKIYKCYYQKGEDAYSIIDDIGNIDKGWDVGCFEHKTYTHAEFLAQEQAPIETEQTWEEKITAKEKAKQLYNQFYEASDGVGMRIYQSKVELAKKSAIIAVDELLALGGMVGNDLSDSFYIYWQEVKNELNQL